MVLPQEMVLEHIDEMMHKQQTTVLQVQHPSVSSSTPPSPGLENEQRSEISLARLVEWQSLVIELSIKLYS